MTRHRPSWLLVLTAFVGVAAITASTAAAAPQRPSRVTRVTAKPATRISGRVLDDQGHPLSGVVVSVESAISYADFHSARTGPDGRYSIRSTPGPQQLTLDGSRATGGDADPLGYVGSRSAVVTARYGRTTSGVDVTMHPAGAVRGHVTDPAGHPLSGVVAWLADVQAYVNADGFDDTELAAGTERVRTHDGVFSIRGVRAGAYQLCFDTTSSQVSGGTSDRAGYETTCGSRVVAAATGRTTAIGSVPLMRSGGGVIFGQVTGRNGHAVAGVQIETRVNRSYFDATTGPDGYYRLQDLPTGTAARICYSTSSVAASTPTGFAPVCRTTPLSVTAGRTYRVDRTLVAASAVRGTARVTHGAPLAGAIVNATWGLDGSNVVTTETDDSGHYVLKNLPATSVDVCVSPDFSAAAGPGDPYGAALGAGSCRTVRTRPSRLTSDVNERLARAGAISGTVRDQDGRPLGNVQIDLEGNTDDGNEGEFYAVTDAHGHYRAVDLPPVGFEVCYSNTFFYEKCYRKPGATHASNLRVHAGQEISGIDETLSTVHNNVSIVVVDGAGHPLPGADAVLLSTCDDPTEDDGCLVQPPAGKQTYTVSQSDVTNAHGRTSWSAVTKGKYTVCAFGYYASRPTGSPVTGYGDTCDPTALTVTATGNQTIRIVLPVDGAVTGRVTDSAGHPLADVRVHISGSAADDFADADYEFETPTPHWDAYTDAKGDYTVRSVAPGPQTACFDPQYVVGPTTYQPQCAGLAPGSTSGGTTVDVVADKTTPGVDVALSPKAQSAGPRAQRPSCSADPLAPRFTRVACVVDHSHAVAWAPWTCASRTVPIVPGSMCSSRPTPPFHASVTR